MVQQKRMNISFEILTRLIFTKNDYFFESKKALEI